MSDWNAMRRAVEAEKGGRLPEGAVGRGRRAFQGVLGSLVVALAVWAAPAWGQGGPGGFPGGHHDVFGPQFGPSPHAPGPQKPQLAPGLDAVRRWNRIAVDASGLDHTPVAAGESRVFGEQYGPTRASRAMAIVHIAIYEAVNAIAGGYASYVGLDPVAGGDGGTADGEVGAKSIGKAGSGPSGKLGKAGKSGRRSGEADGSGGSVSMDAAVSQAAHDTLVAMFPSQQPGMDDLLAQDLDGLTDGDSGAREAGVELGRRAAAAILALRTGDGSDYPEPRYGIEYIAGDGPGQWRQDPVGQQPISLGAYWYRVKPFVMASAEQFRAPALPSLDGQAYADAFNEVKRLGGDGVTTPTERTEDQTHTGIYWAYDGTPSLCAPPRLYNQLTMVIADQRGLGAMELARLLAVVNTSMADAAIAIWESKYYYDFWRPVTGIREADEGTGPTGEGDGNPGTAGDPAFTPLGAPASNLSGPNFTPPFPSYPSGHAGFGGALFQALRRFFGTDEIAFTFTSDEYNGVTVDNQGNVRELKPRSFETLSQAEEENGQSRIYLGIHWAFDKTEGIAQGRRVGDHVFDNAFRPL